MSALVCSRISSKIAVITQIQLSRRIRGGGEGVGPEVPSHKKPLQRSNQEAPKQQDPE